MQPPSVSLRSAPPPPPPGAGRPARRSPARVAAAAAGVAAGAACVSLALSGPAVASQAAPNFVATPGRKKPTREFWTGLWQTHDIAFHRPAVNANLQQFSKQFLGTAPGRVLVPLCGKTLDLVWLGEQPGVTEVVGVEYVQQAVDEFVKENPALKMKKTKAVGPYKSVVSNGKVTLLAGDFFALPPQPQFTRVWDRASLVALDPVQREAYVQTVTAALAPGGLYLLCVFDRAAGPAAVRASGPPFSIPEAEVKRLFGKDYVIKKVNTVDATDMNPGFRKSGLTKVLDVTYLMTKKAAPKM